MEPTTSSPSTFEGANSLTLTHVNAYWTRMKASSPVYAHLIPDMTITAAGRGRILATLLVKEHMLNSQRSLHGSTSATIVDWAGGMAIAATEDHPSATGVSADIHVSYCSPARVGDVLRVEAWVVKMGRTLAFTQVEIAKLLEDGGKGAVVVMGSHTKCLPPQSSVMKAQAA